MAQVMPPYLDDKVEYVGVNKMRFLSAGALAAMKSPIVVLGKGQGKPLAVVLNYQQYLALQKMLVEVSMR